MKILLGCLLLACSMMAQADDSDVSIDVSTIKKNFIITLPANPTTGYQWTVVQYDTNLFSLSTSKYQKSQTNLIGSGGQMIFIFNLNSGKAYPANTKMTFKYARSWELDTGTIKNVTVNFIPSQF